MKTIRIFCFLLVCFASKAQTEKNVDHQSLLWTRYYNQLTLNNKWSIHTEFDNRIFLNPVEENLYVIRLQGRYKINTNLEVGGGFAYFSVATQDPDVTSDFRIPEYRAQQDIVYKQDFGRFTLNQRFQVEERFIHNANKQELLPGTTFYWRFRYRLQGEYSCWKKENQYLKAIVYDELMINGGDNVVKNTFDQNRIYAALQYGINKNIALELGYLYSFQQRASGVDYFDRDIIRFSFYHKIKLKEKHKVKTN
jgi:opacity protein-like surface antigen